MTQSRAEQVDLDSTPYYHCISRCVRRAYLCGEDVYTGKSFEHRKGWIVQRLKLLSSVFAIDVCAYAVMSNHFHLVLRVDVERAMSWSEEEVLERYARLFSNAKRQLELLTEEARSERVEVFRGRLSDLSWMMRSVNEWVARRANKEDDCKGRFWEGRFKSQALLDEAAVLTCMTYVDLNPVRAGVCARIDVGSRQGADFTSIEARLREASVRMDEVADDAEAPRVPEASLSPAGLMPFADQAEDDEAGVPMTFVDYVQLLDWTGRAVRRGSARIEGAPPALMQRLGLEPEVWLGVMSKHGLRTIGVLGRADEVEAHAARQGKAWLKGQRWARKLFRRAA